MLKVVLTADREHHTLKVYFDNFTLLDFNDI